MLAVVNDLTRLYVLMTVPNRDWLDNDLSGAFHFHDPSVADYINSRPSDAM
jgi:hypothetical protein